MLQLVTANSYGEFAADLAEMYPLAAAARTTSSRSRPNKMKKNGTRMRSRGIRCGWAFSLVGRASSKPREPMRGS